MHSSEHNHGRRIENCALSTLAAALVAIAVWGCSASSKQPSETPELSDQARAGRATADTQLCNNPKVIDIWKSRMDSEGDFTLGPGDVIQVSTNNIAEIKDKVVRLDATGSVSLPLIGDLKLSGLTEKEAKEEIERKLGDYMYHPQVTVFVQTYHSRQVAVVGAVASPGMFTLSPDETIGSIIQRAGGMSRDASQEILFTPSGTDSGSQRNDNPHEGAGRPSKRSLRNASLDGSVRQVADTEATSQGEAPSSSTPSPGSGKIPGAQPSLYSTELPVMINLVAAGGPGCLGVPLRPGDQIDVPLGGTVKVIGWVASPKPVQLTPGLTALGAVAASGGPLFAADMGNVQIIRQGHNQQAQIIKVDLNKVQELQEPDVFLESNDVVQVPYSLVRLPGYGVYYATVAVIQFAPAALIVSGIP